MRAIAKEFGVSAPAVLKWSKSPEWQEIVNATDLATVTADTITVATQSTVVPRPESITPESFQRLIAKARDDLHSNATLQLSVSTTLFEMVGGAVRAANEEGSYKEAVKISGDVNRLMTAATAAARGAKEIYQTVFAIEELLGAMAKNRGDQPPP